MMLPSSNRLVIAGVDEQGLHRCMLSMARLDQRTHARMYSSAVARNGSPEGPSRHAEWPLIGGLGEGGEWGIAPWRTGYLKVGVQCRVLAIQYGLAA